MPFVDPDAPTKSSFVDPDKGFTDPDKTEEPSALKAFGKSAGEATLPALGGFAGAGLGMSAAAPLAAGATAVGGPIAGGAVEIGAALAGGFGGSAAVAKIQDMVTKLIPEQTLKEYGLDPKTRAKETAAHPYASFAGSLAPNLLAARPGATTAKQAATMAGLGGGIEAGQELIHEGKIDPTKVAMAAAFQAATPKLTKLGEKLTPPLKTAVKPEVASEVQPKEPTVFPAATYPGLSEVRKQETLKVVDELKKSALNQKKVSQAREVLETYPKVQAATSGKEAATRKRLEKYIADPEVMDHIKRAQDTQSAFEQATLPRNIAKKIEKEQQFLNDLKEQGASKEQIKSAQDDVDKATSKAMFPGVPRTESEGWIQDMKSRQKESDLYVVQKEKLPKTLSTSIEQGKRLSLKEPIVNWDYRGKADQRLIMQNTEKLMKLAPDEASQRSLTSRIEDPSHANDADVKQFRSMDDEVWKKAHEEGVIDTYVENHLAHMYDFGKQSKSEAVKNFRRLVEEKSKLITGGMSPKSRFADKRVFKSLQEAAEKAGLRPLTTNPAEIYQISASSLLRATNNKKFLNEIKDVVNPATGEKLIVKIDPKKGTPKGYETINHPQFIGKAVAKDIAPTVRSMFESPSDSPIMNSTHLMSMVAKKGIFSLSAFHIKSLGDAFIGALRNPKQAMQIPSLFRQWKQGGQGDLVDLALKGGLEIGHAPLDVNADVLSGVATDVGRALDNVFPHLGGAIRLPSKFIEGLNKTLWEYIHPSLKLATWAANHERLVSSGIEPLKASEMAATFTNDVFGGLNWRRIAENTNSYLGYKIANEAASRSGKRAMQIAMLAPDWTVATARSWEGAFRKGVSPQERGMYQMYLLQSGLLYAGVADLLNLQFTGKHFWENDDPTMVDLGDGRRLQLSKHFMEVPHWFLHPNQTMLNKFGFVPSEVFKQALNADYLSASGTSPKIVEKGTSLPSEVSARLGHILKGITPITLQTTAVKTPQEAAASALGFPVYGDNEERKLEKKQLKKQKRTE